MPFTRRRRCRSRRASAALTAAACVLGIALTPPAAAPLEPENAISDPEALAWVEGTLAQLDLRERVAQLVVPWIQGGHIARNSVEYRRIRAWIEEDRVGGLIVSRGPASEFAPMLNSLQAMARVPLLIVSDLETGPGMRLTGGTNVPPAMALGAADDEALAFDAGRLTAVEARAAGIHLTLGPVLDVNSNPLNPIINTRSFGEDPERVGRMAGAWIAGARSEGLLTAGKHFPGHGATEVDSHVGLPTLAIDRLRLDALDLVPFAKAIDQGIDALLVGHIAVPAIDGPDAPPASMSPGVITGLLRTELGFEGLVFTDALNMGAVTRDYSVEEAAIRALIAGADVLLQPPGERFVIEAIVKAVEEGRISRDRIDEAARRMLMAKAAAGLHIPAVVTAAGGHPPVTHADIAVRVSSSAVTLARDRDDLIPLPARMGRVLHVPYARSGTRFSADVFAAALRSSVQVETVTVSAATSNYRSLLERASQFDLVIVSANLMPREYRSGLHVDDAYPRFVRNLMAAGIPVIAISFGSPYLIDQFPTVSTYLLAWSDSGQSQRAAARAILGQAPIHGRLPISLPPHHSAGEGVERRIVER
jgi:beta-N-acetylhexosaminidase